MKLTDNFSEDELNVQYAVPAIKGVARILCCEILEPTREHFNAPVLVTSGYRPPDRNAAVGGKPDSYHLYQDGRGAADFKVKDVPVTEVFRWLIRESKLPFDKCILEHDESGEPRIVHVQINVNASPRRLAYIGNIGAGTIYTPVEVLA